MVKTVETTAKIPTNNDPEFVLGQITAEFNHRRFEINGLLAAAHGPHGAAMSRTSASASLHHHDDNSSKLNCDSAISW